MSKTIINFNLSAPGFSDVPTTTVAADDKVIILDTSAADATKTVTAQSIADLGGGGASYGASPGTILLAGSEMIPVNLNNLSTGATTVYTVPTGKRAVLVAATHFNTSGGNIVYRYSASISAVDYNIGNSTTVGSGAPSSTFGNHFILEAGEVLKITTTTNNGLNAFCRILEFPNTIGLKSVAVTSPVSGNNTVYTCPASTVASILTSTFAGFMEANSTMYSIFNNTGAGIDHYGNLVTSGGSPASTNQITISSTCAAGSVVSGGAANCLLAAGDFISVNQSAANSGGLIWSNVIEFAT